MNGILSTAVWLSASIVTSEFLGYLLHRLLHSGKIGFLNRGHMRHHLVLYGPLQSQRPGTNYRDATIDTGGIGNIGLEWLIPGTVLVAVAIGVFQLLHVTAFHQVLSLAVSLAWSFIMFNYLHDRMHIDGFWMERSPCLKRWFVLCREAHDLHHWALNDEGFMDKNFGVAFFWFDRLFGTLANEWPDFNRQGYLNALLRFSDVLSLESAPVSSPLTESTELMQQRKH